MDLYEKLALVNPNTRGVQKHAVVWGTAARLLGRGAWNFGKGLFFAGPSANAGTLSKGLNLAGKATAIGGPLLGSIAPSQRAGPSIGVPAFPGFEVRASVDERLARLVKHARDVSATARTKHALDIPRAVNTGSYLSFLAATQLPHDHPLHLPLEVAGLLGLGATSIHDITQGKPVGWFDLAGLGTMGAGLAYDQLRGGH